MLTLEVLDPCMLPGMSTATAALEEQFQLAYQHNAVLFDLAVVSMALMMMMMIDHFIATPAFQSVVPWRTALSEAAAAVLPSPASSEDMRAHHWVWLATIASTLGLIGLLGPRRYLLWARGPAGFFVRLPLALGIGVMPSLRPSECEWCPATWHNRLLTMHTVHALSGTMAVWYWSGAAVCWLLAVMLDLADPAFHCGHSIACQLKALQGLLLHPAQIPAKLMQPAALINAGIYLAGVAVPGVLLTWHEANARQAFVAQLQQQRQQVADALLAEPVEQLASADDSSCSTARTSSASSKASSNIGSGATQQEEQTDSCIDYSCTKASCSRFEGPDTGNPDTGNPNAENTNAETPGTDTGPAAASCGTSHPAAPSPARAAGAAATTSSAASSVADTRHGSGSVGCFDAQPPRPVTAAAAPLGAIITSNTAASACATAAADRSAAALRTAAAPSALQCSCAAAEHAGTDATSRAVAASGLPTRRTEVSSPAAASPVATISNAASAPTCSPHRAPNLGATASRHSSLYSSPVATVLVSIKLHEPLGADAHSRRSLLQQFATSLCSSLNCSQPVAVQPNAAALSASEQRPESAQLAGQRPLYSISQCTGFLGCYQLVFEIVAHSPRDGCAAIDARCIEAGISAAAQQILPNWPGWYELGVQAVPSAVFSQHGLSIMPVALTLAAVACTTERASSGCNSPHAMPAAPGVVAELALPGHFVQQLLAAGYTTVRAVVGSQPAGAVLLDEEWPLQEHMSADAAAPSAESDQLDSLQDQQQHLAAPAVALRLPLHINVGLLGATCSPLQVLPVMLLGGANEHTGSTDQARAGSATSAGSTVSGTGRIQGAPSGRAVADSSAEAGSSKGSTVNAGRGVTSMQVAQHHPRVLAQLPLLLLPEPAQLELIAFAKNAADSYSYDAAYSLLLPMLKDLGHVILWANGTSSINSAQPLRQLQHAVLDALAACFDRLQLSSCKALLQQLQCEVDVVPAGGITDIAAEAMAGRSSLEPAAAGIKVDSAAASPSGATVMSADAVHGNAVDAVTAASDQGAVCLQHGLSTLEEQDALPTKSGTGSHRRVVHGDHNMAYTMAGRVDSGSSSSSGSSSRGSSFIGHAQHSCAKPNKLEGSEFASSSSSHAQSRRHATAAFGTHAYVPASHSEHLGRLTLLFGFRDRTVEQAYKLYKQQRLHTMDMCITLFYLVGMLLALRKVTSLVSGQASQQEVLVSVMRAVFLVVNALPHALLWSVNRAGGRWNIVGYTVSGQARGAYFISCMLVQVLLLNLMVWLGEPWRDAVLHCMARYQESTLLNLAFRHVVLPVLMRMSVVTTMLHVVLMNDAVVVDGRFEQPPLVVWLGPWASLFVMGGVNVVVAAALEHGMRKGFLSHMTAAR